jgi:hypothetical protein
MSEKKLSVLNPEGYPPTVTARGMAPGLERLEGAKVFLIDIGFENSDTFMAELHGWFRRYRPEVTTEVVRWRNEYQPDPELSRRVKAEGDAAIIGVGT